MRGRRALAVALAFCASGAVTGALAADLGGVAGIVPGAEVPSEGVACESPVVKAFPAVWRGHFTGGYSHYLGDGGPIVLDWRDETLCFPGERSCKRYISEMRRDFHRPEGYFTCLPIR